MSYHRVASVAALALGCTPDPVGTEPVSCPTVKEDTAVETCPPPPEPELPRDADVADAPPFVVSSVPRHMDMAVDPATTELEVTYSRDMGAGYAWLSLGPITPTLGPAEWIDARTNRIEATLEPGTTYAVQLNGGSYYSFTSVDGEPALPFALVFRTAE